MTMKDLVVRFLRDDSGSGGVVSQAVLVTGSALVVIPATNDIATRLIAICQTLTKALR
jgi:Flp pilus assembly pilin Flp